MKYVVVSYYHFFSIKNPSKEIKDQRNILESLGAKGRIYIDSTGINAQFSLLEKNLSQYRDWLTAQENYKEIPLKVQKWHEHAFARLHIKERPLVATGGVPIDINKRGKYISPKEWRKALDNLDKNTVVIDVRNAYETKVGKFKGAICPNVDTFRDFPQWAKDFKKTHDVKKTRVLMCCTGGIRCEFYSAYLKTEGYDDLSQLQGGIIEYGKQEGNAHWAGKLFVFDDRLTASIAEEEAEVIGTCHFCSCKIDTFYNCANMDCNKLFTACKKCAKEHKGCCSSVCLKEGRVREFIPQDHPKPFRRLPKS